eukprot:CAMPEP_0172669766 /NCGR_PEP_ID=MMETSP1074-20121228/9886_1 /TAXON_ID=2916 /ORGANISM="Ceratium fusus, Strain PA161109" /LENGTH=137 /DNA_ID=CAMNT_0013486585 /DNA_START=22 /DNA_END=432 /DNA_ORIENTATION=-
MSLQRARCRSVGVATSETAAAAGVKTVAGETPTDGARVATIKRRWWRLVWVLDLFGAWRDAAKILALLRRLKEETQPARHRPAFLQRPLAVNVVPPAEIQQPSQPLSIAASLQQSPQGLAAEFERAKAAEFERAENG